MRAIFCPERICLRPGSTLDAVNLATGSELVILGHCAAVALPAVHRPAPTGLVGLAVLALSQ